MIVLVVVVGVLVDMVICVFLVLGFVLSVVVVYIFKEGEKNFIFKEYIYLEIE